MELAMVKLLELQLDVLWPDYSWPDYYISSSFEEANAIDRLKTIPAMSLPKLGDLGTREMATLSQPWE
jgi:hypothetical protein